MAIWEVIGKVNKYIDSMAPWELAKKDRDRLATVIFHIVESLKIISALLWPFIPGSAEKMQKALGLTRWGKDLKMTDVSRWGTGEKLNRVKEVPKLFPRVEMSTEEKGGTMEDRRMEKGKELISFQEFQRLDLRIGTVKAAETIKGSKKLIKMTVDLGEERTVVAGILGHYSAEDLIGRQVVIVANLEPAKLMGVESQGMILAAEDDTGVHIIVPDREMRPGSIVK